MLPRTDQYEETEPYTETDDEAILRVVTRPREDPRANKSLNMSVDV